MTDDARRPERATDRAAPEADAYPECATSGCGDDAAFFVYDADAGEWRPICARHARQLHPSLEVHAWLASGYLKPVELGRPEAPPAEPRGGRAAAFRAEVEATMGWLE